MDIKSLIIDKIEKLPDEYLDELLDFVNFLESRALEEKFGAAIASETSLKKDWLSPEEDEAWKDL